MGIQTKAGALWFSLFAVLSIVLVEGLAGFLVNSLALMTDALHAALDAVVTLMLLVATRISARPRDEDHTYGHGKMEALGGLLGGFVLIFFAVSILNIAAMRFLEGGFMLTPGPLGIGAAIFTMVVNGSRVLILKKALSRLKSATVKADLFHAFSNLLSTGVVFVGLLLSSLGIYVGDIGAAVILGLLLVYLSVRLIHSSALELSDYIPKELTSRVKNLAKTTDGVLECRDLHIRKVGQTTFADVVIAVANNLSVDEAHRIASLAEARITKEVGEAEITVHVEPKDLDLPLDVKVKRLISKIKGVQGLHNLTISSTESGFFITVHVNVDAKLALIEAHRLTEIIDRVIKRNLKEIVEVSVHVESYRPELGSGMVLKNREIEVDVKSIASRLGDELNVTKVTNYTSEGKLHIIINCSLDGTLTVEKVHETVSLIEVTVRKRYPGSIVTVHSEPI
ncbi:MAG: cation diffusion facilitator family transporter [Thaumarchaeota archaeon]|nr:cation diffusion facilitator family transporter [Nitrososphaerota archaeon]